MVYRFVTANTIDQRIVERAAAKRKLEKMVIHQGEQLAQCLFIFRENWAPSLQADCLHLLITPSTLFFQNGKPVLYLPGLCAEVKAINKDWITSNLKPVFWHACRC
jgi:hypothetical protein